MGRTDLTEQQWRNLDPHLPPDPHKGHAYTDHRRVINGILWRLKTGATWRDIPERYGPWQTCYDRFVRWSRNGTWESILTALHIQRDAEGNIAGMARPPIAPTSRRTGAPLAPGKPAPSSKKGLDSRGMARSESRRADQQDSRVE